MDCPKCANYYPDSEKCCPYCGCEVSKKKKRQNRDRQRSERIGFAREREKSLAADDRVPVAAVIVSTKTETGKSALGTAARGVVGYALFGVFGAAVGVASGKTKIRSQKVTFSVRYASGRTGIETVEVGSKRFEELAKLIV